MISDKGGKNRRRFVLFFEKPCLPFSHRVLSIYLTQVETSLILTYLILITILWQSSRKSHHHSSHFIDEETEALKLSLSTFPKVT